jgi:hypothetical protein
MEAFARDADSEEKEEIEKFKGDAIMYVVASRAGNCTPPKDNQDVNLPINDP